MKALEILSLTRLTILEFGQHLKTVNQNILELGNTTDAVLLQYLSTVKQQLVEYDKALLQIRKSDETVKIIAADDKRDRALTAMQRQLSVYELSEDESEVEAYTSLNTLLKTYNGLQKWNFEEETNGIENLVSDLNNSKYQPLVGALNMTGFVTRLNNNNNNFKILFDSRIQEVADKVVYDTKVLRTTLKNTYEDMTEYVLAMAKAKDNEEFNKTLDVINAVRQYYADLLAKRKPATATKPEDEIPPLK
jgi:Family of unknown function (DUF6261)